ncbi:HK97 family phage prohead protease [Vulgatibacter sp.]|uniref:HK97 family phage prohead protease n=1 Tax=Vulgatibacter sp. TaxID=1971226 RepID=UPI003564E8F2
MTSEQRRAPVRWGALPAYERRSPQATASTDDALLVGYAVLYDSPSITLRQYDRTFREIIRPGAFDDSLALGDRIEVRWNHERHRVVGDNHGGGLRLFPTPHGIAFAIEPSRSYLGSRLVGAVRREELRMSFRFHCTEHAFEHRGGEMVRVVKRGRLEDVAPVTSPAYPDTWIAALPSAPEASRTDATILDWIRLLDIENRAPRYWRTT